MQSTRDVADRLRAEIAGSGRSLYDIAKAARLGYAAVHRIANNERDGMTVETMIRLAGALGLGVEFRPLRPAGRTSR